jgi:hypothetical protein
MPEVSRRNLLKKFGVGLGIAWTAPVLTSLHIPAAGTPINGTTSTTLGPVECDGGDCDTFVPCSANVDCVCARTFDQDGLCLPGSTECAALTLCAPDGSCPSGSVCIIDSCCVDAVCVDENLTNLCPAIDGDGVGGLRPATGPGTLGP